MRIRNLALGGVVLAIIFMLLPIGLGHSVRNSVAYKLLNMGQTGAAQKIYTYNMRFGDPLATNNYHALRLNEHISNHEVDQDFLASVRNDAKIAFDQVMRQTGQPAATYNAGMMNYRCNRSAGCYRAGLRFLSTAAAAGDQLSRDAHDFMKARGGGATILRAELKAMADRGNGYAAYKYARELRFDDDRGDYLRYAEIGARAGIADAQTFLAYYHDDPATALYWHEQAATNPTNRSLSSAVDLGQHAEERGDYKEARRWYNLAMEPRAPFGYQLIIRPNGIRWRGLQTSREAAANSPNWAAYHLAMLQMQGLGGRQDLQAAIRNLELAGDDFKDAGIMRRQILAGIDPTDPSRAGEANIVFELEKFDKDTRGLHEQLRPLFADGTLRYVTEMEHAKWQTYAESLEQRNPEKFCEITRALSLCSLGTSCFHIEKPVRLPEDMFGGHSATFFVDKSVALSEQAKNHNRFLYERDL